MKRLLILFLSFLLLFSGIAPCSVAQEEEILQWQLIRHYLVLVEDGVEVSSIVIPREEMPEWRFCWSFAAGDLYFLHCTTVGSAAEIFEQGIAETLVAENGVIEYIDFYSLQPDQLGDVNQNGTVEAADALLCLKMVVGSYQPQTIAEYSQTLVPQRYYSTPSKPDASCALHILQMVVGKY